MTIIEVAIACVVLGVLVMTTAYFFRSTSNALSEVGDTFAAVSIENGLRNVVFQSAQASYVAAKAAGSCPVAAAAFTSNMNAFVQRAGIVFSPVTASILAPLTGQGLSTMTVVVNRCALAAAPAAYFAGIHGIYFCALLTPAAGSAAGIDTIWGMAPVVAEFYYTNVDVLLGSEIGCGGFIATANPTVGELFYTLYWVSPRAGKLAEKSYSGMVGFANN